MSRNIDWDEPIANNKVPDVNLSGSDKPAKTSAQQRKNPWKVMVIDDDPGVHDLTSLLLDGFSFMERRLEIIQGYSGEDARRLLGEHPDTAVLLLDVVMETEREGLDIVNYARKVLKNKLIRIVLRTGQPGQSYENEVVTNYEINDYLEKSLTTAQNFNTSIVVALRAYSDLLDLQQPSYPA